MINMKIKKIVIKEFDRKLLGIDIMLYFIIAVIGFSLLKITASTTIDTIQFIPSIFYIIGFFGLITYFTNRRKDDYEFLIFSLINICTATFLIANQNYGDDSFIVADAMLFYALANLLNKCYYSSLLIKEKNINFFPKISISIILALLGIFTVYELYNKIDYGVIIISYYFVALGLISLLEPLSLIIMRNSNVEEKILLVLKYEIKTKEKKNKIRELDDKKPVAIVKDGEIKSKSKKEKNKNTKKTNN